MTRADALRQHRIHLARGRLLFQLPVRLTGDSRREWRAPYICIAASRVTALFISRRRRRHRRSVERQKEVLSSPLFCSAAFLATHRGRSPYRQAVPFARVTPAARPLKQKQTAFPRSRSISRARARAPLPPSSCTVLKPKIAPHPLNPALSRNPMQCVAYPLLIDLGGKVQSKYRGAV